VMQALGMIDNGGAQETFTRYRLTGGTSTNLAMESHRLVIG
jgi:hypothetical protein